MSAWLLVALLQVPAPNDWVDVPLTLGAGAGWLALHLAQPFLVDTTCPCERGEVNAFDRIAVDADLDSEGLADLTLGLALLLPVFGLAAVAPDHAAFFDDALLVAESVAFAGLLTAGVKAAVGRPYPYMYGPAPYPEQNDDGVNYASFWSGHTAVAMAGAVTFAFLYEGRAPDSAWRWVWWTVGPALALGSGFLQVGARNHFPTDVLAGAAAGAGIGWLNPWLRTVW